MGHEISQFDIQDRQLLESTGHPGVPRRTDIGEAKIIRTIFGRARVRVVRERDKKLRAWLLTFLGVMALAAAAWQGWVALQQSELLSPSVPLSERIIVSPPVFQPEDITSSTSPSSRRIEKTPTQIVLDSMMTRRPPPPTVALKAPQPVVAKPDKPQALAPNKTQTESTATNNLPTKNQTDMQQPFKQAVPSQPVAPAIVTPPAPQTEANRPAAVVPPEVPLPKEVPIPLPAGNNQSQGQ